MIRHLHSFLLTGVLLVTHAASAQIIEFANIGVVQNDSGNTANSVTYTRLPGTSVNFSIRGGNRGDIDVAFGTTNDAARGVMISSVSENGRDNTAGGDTIGLFYATSASDFVTGNNTQYWIPVFRAADGDEVNINVACAWFPYNQWLGGFARNSSGTNGGANNTLTASTGINLGTQFIDLGGGTSTVNLTGLGASAANGVLLVNHGKNEDNYALSRANADGTFTVYVHDNGVNGGTYEQDPVAFVYIPKATVGTKQLVAMARVNSDASTDVSGGAFTLTKGGTGQWYLKITGHNNTTGVLIISPEGGGTNNFDNVVSSEWDPANSRWIIESRDLSGGTVQPTLQNGNSNAEDMFSFAFFETPNNAPTATITAPAAEAFVNPATFTIEASAADSDGTIAKVEFLRNGIVVSTDTAAPFTHAETGLTSGVYNYIARATDDDGSTGLSTAKTISVTYDPAIIPANTAVSFDGVDDYITMGAAPELNVGGSPGNGLTLECWFRKEGTGRVASSGSGGVSAVPLFGKGRGEDDGSNIDCNIFFGITTAGLLVADFESMATGLNHPITATNTPITNGAWHHAAVTFDGPTGVWRMYLDGVQVGTSTVSVTGAVPRYDSIQHFGIGAAFNSMGVPEGAFAGSIDEVRVWNHARSASEITAAKNLELASGSGLIGRFGLNEGVGSTVASSTAATTGTLTNTPGWVDGAPFTTANASPTVSLTAPLNSSTSYHPHIITLSADAADADGSVAKVEFLVDGAKVGEDLVTPYSFDWTPPAVGTYVISARVRDNLGAGQLSSSVTVSVLTNPNQAPVSTPASPITDAVVPGTSANLQLGLADPEGDAMTVTFYGRQTVPATPGPDFSIVAIPDTQYYSQAAASRANTVTVEQLGATFGRQTQWVVDNKVARNIAFVAHMGDIVENGNFNGNTSQWQRASSAMANLENPVSTLRAHGIPYGIAPGNHDIDPIGAYDTGSTLFYNQFFGTSRFAGRSYWGGNYGSDNTNNYQLFSASGLDFISIHMAYDTTPNQAILDWADALLKAHPHRRAIVTSHWIVGGGNPATFSNQGAAIYNNLKDNPNLFLLLCGHIHAEGRRADVFEGRTVYSVLSDYQGTRNGGDGLLRIFTFSPANNTISAESWSPTANRIANSSDGLEYFDGPFTVPYNMQTPTSEWVVLGTVNVPAGGTTASLNWTGLTNGKTYEWYAAVTDSISTVSTTPSRFSTAAGSAPTVTLDTPAAGAVYSSPATINLTASAVDADGTVARVEFYSGGTKVGEDLTAPYEFTWTGVTPGTYSLTAIAVDDAGLSGLSASTSITVNPGDFPPTVSLTAPVAGSVFEAPVDITLTADASDPEAAVVKVEFFLGDLTPVSVGEDTTAPFSLHLTDLGPGSHTFTARATDSMNQTTTSAPVTISVFTDTAAPNPANVSVGTFDTPTWTVAKTSPSPRNFNLPGTDVGDLELRINGVSVPFNSGIALANNWAGPDSAAVVQDNLVQPYANASGNLFVSTLDNTNNNAAGANPGTSEQSGGVSVAFLPFAEGFTGASVGTSGAILNGNLPAGVTVTKVSTGLYAINGLSTAGNLFAFTNGDTGTLADNICNVRIVAGRWLIQTLDNGIFVQDNEFSFVYLPPTTTGLYAGRVSAAAVVSNTNASATSLGVTATVSATFMDLTFGDGTVINPTTAALFLTADATNGGDASPAADNLITWSANGNQFRIFTQDLVEVTGDFEAIDLNFLAIPYVAAAPANVVTVTATDSVAGEYGSDQSLIFTVTRTGSTAEALVVPLVPSGTATSGADYSGLLSSITIPAGQTSVTLPLTVLVDDLAEGTETVVITLGSSSSYTAGTPASATASIVDRPTQDWFAQNIADPAKRGPADDADNDGVANIVEYYMGSLPGDGSSLAATTARVSANSAVFHFKRALNRADVTAQVEWSSNLRDWFRSGQNSGGLTVNITESTTSQPTDDPQLIDATATAASGPLPGLLFFRLSVTDTP